MTADDIWVYRENGKFMRRVENDGWTFLNRGPESQDQEIIGIGGYYQVIVVGGARKSIKFQSEWEALVANFTEPSKRAPALTPISEKSAEPVIRKIDDR